MKLTDRELSIVPLVAEGLGNDQIARRLHLSPSTVKTQLATLMTKLNVGTRVQLAVWWVLHGIRELEEDQVLIRHIRYVTGDNPICSEPVDTPQYYIFFDIEEGPRCETCEELVRKWLTTW